ncbi:MAG: bifunctional riboflavin kinase/FAD synthetase [Eubacterium sp.]
MQCISVNDNIQLKNTIVTVGKFDGIHKGHEKLLDVIAKNANGRQKVVLTFATSPGAFLKNNANKTIVTEEEKQILCEQQGIDVYMKMPMEKEFLALTPDAFVSEILKDKIGATTIVCGPDFHFGAGAKGNVEFLKTNQKKYGYKLIVVEKEQYNNKDISSTAIREKISEGKMLEVNEMLDHPYRIIGKVEQGKQLGRTMGLPTANIIPDETKLLPPNGVYRTVVVVNNRSFNAISNVGINPTVETGTRIKVETHIIDYKDYIYNEIVQVQFYDFIRPERTFESVEELKKQINADIKKCRNIVDAI